MTSKNVKQRDVWTFEEFVKSTDLASKVTMLKKGENANPGAHTIKAESTYVRNDANPYKAFGIEHDERQADINDRMNANRTHIFDGKTDRVDVITGNKGIGDGAKTAIDLILNGMQAGVIIDESAKYNLQDLDRNISKIDESTKYKLEDLDRNISKNDENPE